MTTYKLKDVKMLAVMINPRDRKGWFFASINNHVAIEHNSNEVLFDDVSDKALLVLVESTYPEKALSLMRKGLSMVKKRYPSARLVRFKFEEIVGE